MNKYLNRCLSTKGKHWFDYDTFHYLLNWKGSYEFGSGWKKLTIIGPSEWGAINCIFCKNNLALNIILHKDWSITVFESTYGTEWKPASQRALVYMEKTIPPLIKEIFSLEKEDYTTSWASSIIPTYGAKINQLVLKFVW